MRDKLTNSNTRLLSILLTRSKNFDKQMAAESTSVLPPYLRATFVCVLSCVK